ncbi:uncharacterized protein PG986_007082 [Apiospora aurea]|uniref:Uncharacterized protein n=1 Tax=Apiospora aurea TaxID=335848 RepID=A0ABR1QBJ8_9PEZI
MSSRAQNSHRNNPGGEAMAFDLEEIPSLFLATNGEEVHEAMNDDGDDINEIFKGYNALHWHCDTPSTSPSLIWALVSYGIDINAFDQHNLPPNSGAGHPPLARRTALGYACFNGNVKALGGQEKPAARPKYPSPLQDLLSQQIGGPTGECPFSYHLTTSIAASDDNNDDVPRSYYQILHGCSHGYGSGASRPECKRCSFGFDVVAAARLDAAGRASQAARAEDIYAAQVELASMRVLKCGKLLLENMKDEQLSQGHDATLPPPIDCLLRSVWHFLGPTLLCWRNRFAQRLYGLDTATLTHRELVRFIAQDPSVTALDLQPWASLVVHAMAASPPGP